MKKNVYCHDIIVKNQQQQQMEKIEWTKIDKKKRIIALSNFKFNNHHHPIQCIWNNIYYWFKQAQKKNVLEHN